MRGSSRLPLGEERANILLLACCYQEGSNPGILERLNRLSTAPQRLRVQYGYLKKLPDDYTGPRHAVTARRLPGPGADSGEDWFEWEERAGPEPASNATGRDDEILVHVCYVDAKMKA